MSFFYWSVSFFCLLSHPYKRELTQKIIKRLSQNPSVAILGPRQIGKTTLAHEIAKGQPSIYLDLEKPEDFQKLKDPAHYLELHANKLVILDEVQRYPDLFMSLLGIIDARHREGIGKGLSLKPLLMPYLQVLIRFSIAHQPEQTLI